MKVLYTKVLTSCEGCPYMRTAFEDDGDILARLCSRTNRVIIWHSHLWPDSIPEWCPLEPAGTAEDKEDNG